MWNIGSHLNRFISKQSRTFHDRDIAPVGKTLAETNANLDKITDLALELQKETGIKLLWGTQNLFSHKMYACGAATAPEAHVFAAAWYLFFKSLTEIALKSKKSWIFP